MSENIGLLDKKDICIICKNNTDSLLIKSCENKDCNKKIHKKCLIPVI